MGYTVYLVCLTFFDLPISKSERDESPGFLEMCHKTPNTRGLLNNH